jgi:hypothetical protein
MKSFKTYISEDGPRQKKVFKIITSPEFYLPFSHSLNKRIFGGNPKLTAFHVFSPHNTNTLIKNQGKRSGISTFTNCTDLDTFKDMMGGIAHEGGFVAELEGDVLGKFGDDVYSIVDKSNRRWVEISNLYIANNDFDKKPYIAARDKFMEEIALDIWNSGLKSNGITHKNIFDDYIIRLGRGQENDFDEMIKNPWFFKEGDLVGGGNLGTNKETLFSKMVRVLKFVKEGDNTNLTKNYKMIKGLIIKQYMDAIEALLTKNKDEYETIQLGVKTEPDTGYNEVIMSNYKLIKTYAVYWDRNYKGKSSSKDYMKYMNSLSDENEIEYLNAFKSLTKAKIDTTLSIENDSGKVYKKVFNTIKKKFS